MRLMLKFTIPVDKGNKAAKKGTIGPAIEALIKQANAEAAYFYMEDGKRAGMIIFEATDQAQMTKLNEPLMTALDAAIEIQPVLTVDDLQKGLPG